MTIRDVAARLGISYPTARKLVEEGAFRAWRIGQRWRVDADSVEAYLRRAEVPAAPSPAVYTA